jgi:hypothetical protein
MITGVDPVTDGSETSPEGKPPARDKGKKGPGAAQSRGSGDSRNARGSGDSR